MDLLENNVGSRPLNVVLMGLDVGKKTIGVALSDSSQKIATPLKTVKRTKFRRDLMALEEIIRDYHVGGYVIGYPLHMDGSAGVACQSVRDFALEFKAQLSDDLKAKKGVWISFQDERLSTDSVEGIVDNIVGLSKRKAKDRGLIDKLAAQSILQNALDYMNGCA